MTERKYVLTRITSGDYIFPSNDGRTLWRISSYEEDGSAWFGDGTVLRGTFWQASYFDAPMAEAQRLIHDDPDEFLSWEHWAQWATTLRTRKQAIEEAMRRG